MRYRYFLSALSTGAFLSLSAHAEETATPPAPAEASAAPMGEAAAPPPPGDAATPSEVAPAGPTPAQTLSMNEWPAEKRTAYDSWPAGVQAYYWSLTEKRQGLFWRLGNEDKVKLAAIPPDSQSAAWERIEQMAAAPQNPSSSHSDQKPAGPGR